MSATYSQMIQKIHVNTPDKVLGMLVHTCIPALGRLQQKDEEFKARLGYIANSKPLWATQDSNSKANKQTSKRGKISTLEIFIKTTSSL